MRQFNPMLLPIIEKEVKKLFEENIIVPLIYSKWVANLVPVRKMNGEIRLCIDFREQVFFEGQLSITQDGSYSAESSGCSGSSKNFHVGWTLWI